MESKTSKKKQKESSSKEAKGKYSKGSKVKSSTPEQSLIDVKTFMQGDADVSQVSMCGEDQTFGQDKLKDVNEYLKGKVGADITAKKWLEGCSGLNNLEKSEVIMRLVYEVCLAKNIEYDLENDAMANEKENNKDIKFDTRRIFGILKKVNHLLLPKDRRRLVELICQSRNVKLLEMICQQENKDGVGKALINQQYLWKGEFTGYETLTDLLQYVLKHQCSSEIVLCIAKKVYGRAHILCNGEQYLNDIQVTRMKESFDYPDSVMKNCLKAAIELGYKDVVSVMLSGDVYQCIRLITNKRFQEEEIFSEAFNMIEETVAEVISSWVKGQSCRNEVLSLLKKGIEIDINEMGRQTLIDELESREIQFSRHEKKENLVKKLMNEGGRKVRLSKSVVGALISTLFFNYQDDLMKAKEQFKLETSIQDEYKRNDEINKLNERIDSKSFVKEKVLQKIESLNSNSYMRNNWFFREVLVAIVNDEVTVRWFSKLRKLQAVCAAIRKKPMQEFLKGVEVSEEVMIVLKFFGVEPNRIKTSIPKEVLTFEPSRVSVVTLFAEDIENLVNLVKGVRELENHTLMGNEMLEIAKGLVSSKVPAFSGLSTRTIIKLKNMRDKTNDKAKDLKEKVLKIVDEIKEGIDFISEGVNREYHIDIEDIFRQFKIINSEIENEDKKEIVKLVVQKDNVKLLEMICDDENKDARGIAQINQQYYLSTSCDPPEKNMTLNQVRKGSLLEELVVYLEKVQQQSLLPLSDASKKRHSTSNLADERVTEKSDKSFLQNNCGQSENGCYNKDENSQHDGKVGSISRRLGVPRVNFRDLEDNFSLKQRSQMRLSSSDSSMSSVGEETFVLQSSSREQIKKRGFCVLLAVFCFVCLLLYGFFLIMLR